MAPAPKPASVARAGKRPEKARGGWPWPKEDSFDLPVKAIDVEPASRASGAKAHKLAKSKSTTTQAVEVEPAAHASGAKARKLAKSKSPIAQAVEVEPAAHASGGKAYTCAKSRSTSKSSGEKAAKSSREKYQRSWWMYVSSSRPTPLAQRPTSAPAIRPQKASGEMEALASAKAQKPLSKMCPKKMGRPRSAPSIRPASHSPPRGPSLRGVRSMWSPRETSAPLALKAGSPLKAKQDLVTVDITARRWCRQAVDESGHISFVSKGGLCIATAERGLEYGHRFGVMDAPAEELPSLPVVIEAVRKEFDMNTKYLSPKRQKRASSAKKRQKHDVSPEIQICQATGSSSCVCLHKPVALPSPENSEHLQAFDSQLAPFKRHGSTTGSNERNVSQPAPEAQCSPSRRESSLRQSEVHQPMVENTPEALPAIEKAPQFPREEELVRTRSSEGLVKNPSAVKLMWMHSHIDVASNAAEENRRLIPWDESQLLKVFNRFKDKDTNEVFVDDLSKVLALLGIRGLDDANVASIAKSQTRYSSLDISEFEQFLRSYRTWEIAECQRLYEESDQNRDGKVDLDELHNMVRKLGYHTTWNTVLEVHLAFGRDRNQAVGFEEFQEVLHHLRSTSGIAGKELTEWQAIFSRSMGGSTKKEVSAEDVWRIIMYAGYPAEREDVLRLTKEADENGNGLFDFYQFLKVVRTYRDFEHECIAQLVAKHSKRGGTAAIPLTELGTALGELGYHVSHALLSENLEHLFLELEIEDHLTVAELTRLIQSYRRTEGFSREEVEDFRLAFQRGGGANDSASVGVLGLGQALRWLGWGMKLQARQKAVREVNLDCSGTLEFNEFLKLLRRLHTQETLRRRHVFHAAVRNTKQRLPVSRLMEVMKHVTGMKADHERMSVALAVLLEGRTQDSAVEEDDTPSQLISLNIHEFDNICEIYRKLDAIAAREYAGYTSREIQGLRKVFHQYDCDHSGTIERSELRKLVAASFPEATRSAERRKWVEQLLLHIDADSNGQLDFQEFLWLMSVADDSRDAADMAAEETVVAEIGLSSEETEGFREIFLNSANSEGEVGVADVMGLLKFADFSLDQASRIAELVAEVGTLGHDGIRFPEFLCLLHRVSEDRELGVKQASLRITQVVDQRVSLLKRTSRRPSGRLSPGRAGSRRPSITSPRPSTLWVSQDVDSTTIVTEAMPTRKLSNVSSRGSAGSRRTSMVQEQSKRAATPKASALSKGPSRRSVASMPASPASRASSGSPASKTSSGKLLASPTNNARRRTLGKSFGYHAPEKSQSAPDLAATI